jgi:hypothetical protein
MIFTEEEIEKLYIKNYKPAIEQVFISSHTHPRRMDHVVDLDRAEAGVEEHGWVTSVNYSNRTVDVRYYGGPVTYNGDDQTVWINGIRHHISILDEIKKGAGDREQYDLDEFEGCWDSHEDGDGTWYIGGSCDQ